MLHLGQPVNWRVFSESCERRLPVLEFECLRFGTAIWIRPVNLGGPEGCHPCVCWRHRKAGQYGLSTAP